MLLREQFMSEIWRGWQRKCGILALMMACLFALAWVRSRMYNDQITISLWRAKLLIVSGKEGVVIGGGYLSVITYYDRLVMKSRRAPFVPPAEFRFPSGKGRVPWIRWRTDTGRRVVVYSSTGQFRPQVRLTPYVLIVIPLMALAAWLLLSKPNSVRWSRYEEAIDYFFLSARRQLGMVTLVIMYVLALMWIRSNDSHGEYHDRECIKLPLWDGKVITLESEEGKLTALVWRHDPFDYSWWQIMIEEGEADPYTGWRVQSVQDFVLSKVPCDGHGFIVPHRALVLPLTLLAGWLLLSRPSLSRRLRWSKPKA